MLHWRDPAKQVLGFPGSHHIAGATQPGVGWDETVVAGGVHLYIEDREKPPFANRAPGSVGQCDAILQGRQYGCRSAGSLRRVKRTLGTRSRSRHLACQFSTRCSMEQPQAPAASLHRESRRRSIFTRPRRRTSELCPNGKTHAYRCHTPGRDPRGGS